VNEYRRDSESLASLDEGMAGTRLKRPSVFANSDFGVDWGRKQVRGDAN